MFDPRLHAYRGGWMAVGDGLAVTASSGQEALLRLAVEQRRRAESASGDGAIREDVVAESPAGVTRAGVSFQP